MADFFRFAPRRAALRSALPPSPSLGSKLPRFLLACLPAGCPVAQSGKAAVLVFISSLISCCFSGVRFAWSGRRVAANRPLPSREPPFRGDLRLLSCAVPVRFGSDRDCDSAPAFVRLAAARHGLLGCELAVQTIAHQTEAVLPTYTRLLIWHDSGSGQLALRCVFGAVACIVS